MNYKNFGIDGRRAFVVYKTCPDADRPCGWEAAKFTEPQREALARLARGPGKVHGNVATALEGHTAGVLWGRGPITGWCRPALIEEAGAVGAHRLWRLTDAGRAVAAEVAQ